MYFFRALPLRVAMCVLCVVLHGRASGVTFFCFRCQINRRGGGGVKRFCFKVFLVQKAEGLRLNVKGVSGVKAFGVMSLW